MDQLEASLSKKDTLIYSYKVVQLSKALWKMVEKDWQQWIKPFGLNINEHHILWIAHYLGGATISDISKFGVMHVSTAFNFSKKLEERGYLTFSKKDNDKRNTYVYLTKEGKKLLAQTFESYMPQNDSVLKGSLPLRNLYGKFPEFPELFSILREIYGSEFTKLFEASFEQAYNALTEAEQQSQLMKEQKEPTYQNN